MSRLSGPRTVHACDQHRGLNHAVVTDALDKRMLPKVAGSSGSCISSQTRGRHLIMASIFCVVPMKCRTNPCLSLLVCLSRGHGRASFTNIESVANELVFQGGSSAQDFQTAFLQQASVPTARATAGNQLCSPKKYARQHFRPISLRAHCCCCNCGAAAKSPRQKARLRARPVKLRTSSFHDWDSRKYLIMSITRLSTRLLCHGIPRFF